MLLYIIDGFNIVHKVPSLKNSFTPHRDLIHYIKRNRLTGSRNNKVIIVFDGRTVRDIRESEFEVVFSGDVSADEVIKNKVDKVRNKSEVIVVSDDREIREYVRKVRVSSVRVADFIKTKKRKFKKNDKEISYSLQREITEELKKIWLKE
jgi:predicted RNA-binding protein with PIN domain